MLYRNLLRHRWKEFIRNPSWRGISVAYAIFLVLLVLYFLLSLALTGVFIGHLLTSQDPAADVVRLVNQHLLSVFLLLFLARVLFQNTPQLKIGPYLHLPVSRPALVRFFSLASLFHLHNLLPLAFFIPFWIGNLALTSHSFTIFGAHRLQKCKYHMAVGFRGITEVCRRIAVIERGVIVRDIRTAPDTLRELECYFAVEEM